MKKAYGRKNLQEILPQKDKEEKMKEVKVRDTVLGSGIPKVCVPVTAKQKEDIFGQARAAADACIA